MLNSNLARTLTTIAFLTCLSDLAAAQSGPVGSGAAKQPNIATTPGGATAVPGSTAAQTTTAATPAVPATASQPAAAPVPAQPPPPPAPAAAAPVVAVPPGYALVPVDSNGAQTRYDVEYPQAHGALPPGMELPYEEGEPIPEGYRVVKQSRRGLVIAGSIVGGISYGFSIVGAVQDDFNHKSGSLLVPVLGPWLMLALGGAKDSCSRTTYGDYDCDKSGLRGMLVLDGLTQLAGATMLTVGLAFPRTRLVRKDVTVSMTTVPLGRDGYGLAAIGQF